MRDRTMFILSVGVMAAILAAIVGDYVVAAMETQTTGEAVEVSSDVMTLVQTALGGVIGILGGYFGSKGASKGNCDSSCQNKTE
jgi:ABC-type xylose transport system permease subunit